MSFSAACGVLSQKNQSTTVCKNSQKNFLSLFLHKNHSDHLMTTFFKVKILVKSSSESETELKR